jgi:hypothetical protein
MKELVRDQHSSCFSLESVTKKKFRALAPEINALKCFPPSLVLVQNAELQVFKGWYILSNKAFPYCLSCFPSLVLLVNAAKIPFKEQVIVLDTKQSSQDDKAGRPNRQLGLLYCFRPPSLFCAYY